MFVRRLGLCFVVGGASLAHAGEACVRPEVFDGDDDRLAALVATLQIETHKRGRTERWTLDDGTPCLGPVVAADGEQLVVDGVVAGRASSARDAATRVLDLLEGHDRREPLVPILPATRLRPTSAAGWGAAATTHLTAQPGRGFAGFGLAGRHRSSSGRVIAWAGGGIGLPLQEEVYTGEPVPRASVARTYHALAGLVAGPRLGRVTLRFGAAAGLRWHPVRRLDVAGVFRALEGTDQTVEDVDQDHLSHQLLGVPTGKLLAELEVPVAPHVHLLWTLGAEGYAPINQTVDSSPDATIVQDNGPAHAVVSSVGLGWGP